MEQIFEGTLKSIQEMGEGPFILFPTYIFPLEVFSRGLATRPTYSFFVALVDAVSGSVSLYPANEISVLDSDLPGLKKLQPKVSIGVAAQLAEEAGRTAGKNGKWVSAFRVNSVKVDISKAKAAWRAWRLDGESLTDTLTGRVEEFGAVLATLLGERAAGKTFPSEEG